MAHVLQELLLYCCLAAFVTGIVLAARSPMSATLFRWEGWTDHAPMDQVQSQFDCLIML